MLSSAAQAVSGYGNPYLYFMYGAGRESETGTWARHKKLYFSKPLTAPVSGGPTFWEARSLARFPSSALLPTFLGRVPLLK